jgi:hypothetical protein
MVLGFLQLFVMSNGDVLMGCYSLPPVGNILKQSYVGLGCVLPTESGNGAQAMFRDACAEWKRL